MATAATPASTIALILREFSEADGIPAQRWSTVLDANYGTPEFALRHAAVVEAFHRTGWAIMAEPSSRGRDARYAQLYKWWVGLMGVTLNWEANANMSLTEESLQALDMTAEWFEGLAGDSSDPTPDMLNDLLMQAQDWVKEVEAEPALNRGLKATILQHLQALIWAIENADRFGAGLILAEADRASGALLRATATTPGLAKRWGAKVALLLAAIVTVATGVNQTVDAIEHGITIVQGELASGDASAGGSATDKETDYETEKADD